MKAVFHAEVTDQQRDQLATLLDGKATKRLASRADICALLQGALDGALDLADPCHRGHHFTPLATDNASQPLSDLDRATRGSAAQAVNVPPDLQQRIDTLRRQGWSASRLASYQRGAMAVVRAVQGAAA